MRVSLVAGVAENGVIGADGDIPWHYPADLAHFKETTVGHPVIMGRRTYESIVDRLGRPLPDRTSIVLSRRDPDEIDLPSGVVHADGVAAALTAAERDGRERGVETVYVVGGATVYEQFLEHAEELVVTEIPETPAGDTHFPTIDPDVWQPVDRAATGELTVVTYHRVPA